MINCWLLFVFAALTSVSGESYVKSVDCNKYRMSVVLSNTSSLWRSNSVFGVFYNVPGLGYNKIVKIKVLPHEKPDFSVTYTNFDLHFLTTYGAGGEALAYSMDLQFRAVGCDDLSCIKTTTANYTFSAYCVIPAHVHESTKKNVTGNGGHGGGGGHNFNATDAVQMNLTDQNGQSIRNPLFLGDPLRLTIHLTPGNHGLYNSTVPTNCYFSNSMENSIAELPFITNSCPDYSMISIFPYIERVFSPNLMTYVVDFKAFLFGNSKFGTLALTCDILLCINVTECKAIFDQCGNWRIHLIASRELKSKKMSAVPINFQSSTMLYTRKELNIQVVPDVQTTTSPQRHKITHSSNEACVSLEFLYFLYGTLGVTGGLFVLLLVSLVCMLCGANSKFRRSSEDKETRRKGWCKFGLSKI